MVESRLKVTEIESSRAAANDDLKKPDPDERTAAEIIERNTVGKKGGAANENPKKSD